jgi:hypothetical protein
LSGGLPGEKVAIQMKARYNLWTNKCVGKRYKSTTTKPFFARRLTTRVVAGLAKCQTPCTRGLFYYKEKMIMSEEGKALTGHKTLFGDATGVTHPDDLKTNNTVPMNPAELAQAMLDYGKLRAELESLGDAIKSTILAIGETQTVGNVKATFRKGRKSYDYEGAQDAWPQEVVDRHTTETLVVKTDWKAACKEQGLEAPYTEGEPSVKIKLV